MTSAARCSLPYMTSSLSHSRWISSIHMVPYGKDKPIAELRVVEWWRAEPSIKKSKNQYYLISSLQRNKNWQKPSCVMSLRNSLKFSWRESTKANIQTRKCRVRSKIRSGSSRVPSLCFSPRTWAPMRSNSLQESLELVIVVLLYNKSIKIIDAFRDERNK